MFSGTVKAYPCRSGSFSHLQHAYGGKGPFAPMSNQVSEAFGRDEHRFYEWFMAISIIFCGGFYGNNPHHLDSWLKYTEIIFQGHFKQSIYGWFMARTPFLCAGGFLGTGALLRLLGRRVEGRSLTSHHQWMTISILWTSQSKHTDTIFNIL